MFELEHRMPNEDDLCTNEKQLEHLILDWLVAQDNVFAIKINTVGVYNARKKTFMKPNNKHIHRGVSDILAVVNGRFLAVEVKYAKGKPSEYQTRFIDRIKDNGGVAFWCNSYADFKYKYALAFSAGPVVS